MTNNEVLDTISHLEAGVVFAWIVGILAIVSGFIVALVKCYRLIERYRKGRNKLDSEHKTFEEMQEADKTTAERLTVLELFAKSKMRKSLLSTMAEYIDAGFIPADELDDLVEDYSIYEKLGGNGKVKTKYDKIIKELPVK